MLTSEQIQDFYDGKISVISKGYPNNYYKVVDSHVCKFEVNTGDLIDIFTNIEPNYFISIMGSVSLCKLGYSVDYCI